MTTHFLEEADILGDRIAVLDGGEIKCIGSPYFLKSHLGKGFTFSVVKESDCTLFKEISLKRFLFSSLPGIEVFSAAALEISFRVPFTDTPKLPE